MAIKINLGVDVHDFSSNMRTENIPLEQFKYNLLIWGRDRSEKIALLSHILNQFHARIPKVGVLLIRLDAHEDSNFFYLDKTYEYGDSDLIIPYFFEREQNEKNREQFENFINAIFGFHFEMRIVIGCVLRNYKVGEFPSSFVDFLEEVKLYLINNPYSEDFTQSNISSVEKAIELLQEDPILERTLWISLQLPEWLKSWSEGETVCIDLSQCDLYYQRLLVALILQAVKNYVPYNNSELPIGVIAIEDADEIFQRPPYEEYREYYGLNSEYWDELREQNYFLTKEQIEEACGDKSYLSNVQFERIISRIILDEFQYKNISLINVCRDPSNVYDIIIRLTQIKLNLDRIDNSNY